MAFRKELGYVTIFAGDFQEFDHGRSITMPFPKGSNIQVGDTFDWACCQLTGTARVVGVDGDHFIVNKH